MSVTDITAQILANQNIFLNGNVSANVPSGAPTAYTGMITGAGSITLTSGGTGGGSLALKNGPTFYLPDANETETATLANGKWTVREGQDFETGQSRDFQAEIATRLFRFDDGGAVAILDA